MSDVSDEKVSVSLATAAKKRGARKPKVRVDAEEAPIDGDTGEMLALVNEDPKFAYSWQNEFSLGKFGPRGYEIVRWGKGCTRPKFYFGEEKDGEPIRYRELVLCRLPKDRAEAIQERSAKKLKHKALIEQAVGKAQATGGSFTHKTQFVRP